MSEARTIAELVSLYCQDLRTRAATGQCRAHTAEFTAFKLQRFARQFGAKRVSECHKRDLEQFLAANPQWRSPHTRNDAIAAVLRCFRWLLVEQVIERLPYQRVKGLIAPLRPRPAMKEAQYRAVMDIARECNGRIRRTRPSRTVFRMALWFLWETGSRTCEMRAVRFRDVDWQHGVVRLDESKTAHVTGIQRIIPLGSRALRLVRWLYRRRRATDDDRIFLNGRGRPWKACSFARTFRAFAKMAGVKGVSPYAVRHLFTVRGLEAGIGERQLADVLGHTSTRFVSWYGRGSRTNSAYLNRSVEQVNGRKPKAIDAPPEPAPIAEPADPPRSEDNAGGRAQRRLAEQYYQRLLARVQRMRADENMTLAEIARQLNIEGQQTRFGRPWTASTVRHLLCRARPLGKPATKRQLPAAFKESIQQQTEAGARAAARVVDIVLDMRGRGITLQATADFLNAEGCRTGQGHLYTAAAVWVVYNRHAKRKA